jgi:hypothetical protein
VLMRRHGATVAGTSIRELIFRTVFGSDNCKLLAQAMAMGHVDTLSPGEAKLTSAHQQHPPSTNRAWDYWVRQVEKAGLMPKAPAHAAAPPAKRIKAKAAKKTRTRAATRKRR